MFGDGKIISGMTCIISRLLLSQHIWKPQQRCIEGFVSGFGTYSMSGPTVANMDSFFCLFFPTVSLIHIVTEHTVDTSGSSGWISLLTANCWTIVSGCLPNIARNAIVNCSELVTYDIIKELILKYNLMTGRVQFASSQVLCTDLPHFTLTFFFFLWIKFIVIATRWFKSVSHNT